MLRASLVLLTGLLAVPLHAAEARDCRTDLASAPEGMIEMRSPARVRAVSSREALGLLGQHGERSQTLNFRRDVEDFWRRKVKRSVEPNALAVRYSIAGLSGQTGFAEHRDNGAQRFPVRVIPKPPRVLCEDREYRIVSGGFTLDARAGGIGLAGLYALEIDVDVTER